jgi:hypothetical protein
MGWDYIYDKLGYIYIYIIIMYYISYHYYTMDYILLTENYSSPSNYTGRPSQGG